MKNIIRSLLLSAFLISINSTFLFSQCTLTGDGDGQPYTHGEVLACLGMCTNCTITITGGIVDLTEPWNLTSKGNISITINAGASLRFGSGDVLTLTAGSSITLNAGMPDGMLTRDGTLTDDNEIVIVKGSTNVTALQLSSFTPTNGILPVVLQAFEGVIQNQAVRLTWQTATELNNAKFIIQTSPEGEIFNNIGEIAGAGTTTEPKSYSFTHQTPSAGANYYRLKQVDFDGTFAYSKVLAINAPGSNDIFAFPNPAKDKITLQYDYSKGAGSIQLFDALGRRLKTNIGGYAGNYEVVLPEGLAKGTYWLKVERAGKVQTVPVVKE